MTYTDWVKSTNGERGIYTFYQLDPTEVLKGEVPESTIVMRSPGGEKDGVGLDIAGSAKFTRGEDVVVLLSNPNPDGSRTVRGLTMGKFNIIQDSNGREVLAGPGLKPTEPGQVSDEHDHADSKAPVWTLDALRALINAQRNLGPKSIPSSVQTSSSQSSSATPKFPETESAPTLQIKSPEGSTDDPRERFRFALIAFVVLIGGFLTIWLLRK